MRTQLTLIFFFIGLVGIVLVYLFWPQNETLPILDKVNNFQLEEVHGDIYQLNNDKIKLVTFFYTHCPNICPLTMMDFKDLQAELEKEGTFGKEVELVSISLDPENDSSKVIKDYANSFEADPSGWKWLRGSPEKTKQIAKELQMQYQKIEGEFFAHSTTMFLMDKNNNIRALYDMAYSNNPINKDKILEDIHALVNGH